MRSRNLANIYDLGVKELWSLWRDPMMLVLIVYVFTASVYMSATAMPDTLHNAPIAIVDEDNSALSQRIASAFYPPQFISPATVSFGRSAMAVVMVILGGMGKIPGVVLGAFLVVLGPELLRDVGDLRLLVFAVGLLLIMLLRPSGIWPSGGQRR